MTLSGQISIKSPHKEDDTESVLEYLGIDQSHLKMVKPVWKRSYYRAIINWLKQPEIQNDSSNLGKIK